MDEIPDDFKKDSEALRRRVFSSVTHDLKTPLACIIGSLGALDQMGTKLSQEQRDTLVKIALSQAHELDKFITEMLETARL